MDYRKLRAVVEREKIQYPEYLKHKEEFIESMKVLITRYERAIAKDVSKTFLERDEGLTCLLCKPVGLDTSPHHLFSASCVNLGCPWVVITGDICDLWCKSTTGESVYSTKDKKLQQIRIDQLKHWIELYKAYVEVN